LARFADEVSDGSHGCVEALHRLVEVFLTALRPQDSQGEQDDGQTRERRESFETLLVVRQDLRRAPDQ
jgi:hypothetical protein